MGEKNIETKNTKGKTFCVADIHGANKALLQVLERSGFNNEEDTLISLGDIADGWQEVPECVDTLLGIKNLIAIRGNHDIWLRDWLKSDYDNPMWRPQGGQASYDAYLNKLNYMTSEDYESWKEKHIDFFENQVDYYTDENNNLFVHAGWDYGWKVKFLEGGLYPVNGGDPKDNIAKECHWSRELFYGVVQLQRGGVPNLQLALALNQYNQIFVGHTSLPEPYEVFNFNDKFYNLDTGAGWSGRLSLINIETGEIFQSDLTTDLYPNMRGRK